MTEPLSNQDVIDAAAAMVSEELTRFDSERQQYRREIDLLRRQVAAAAATDAGELLREIEQLHRQLVDADDYVKIVADEADDLRQRLVSVEGQLMQARNKIRELERDRQSLPDGETRKMVRPVLSPPPSAPVPQMERRSALRRKGNPVPVAILGTSSAEPCEGWVLDRSTGGLGLRMDQRMYLGEGLKVRSSRGHTAAWIDLVVCYCHAEGANFRTGARFLRELSYLDIQQFG
jgi:hypothetical protein